MKFQFSKLTILSLLFLSASGINSLFSQSAKGASLEGQMPLVYVNDYSGSFQDLELIAQSSEIQFTKEEAIASLKKLYKDATSSSINNSELKSMLDPIPANVTIWKEVYNATTDQSTKDFRLLLEMMVNLQRQL